MSSSNGSDKIHENSNTKNSPIQMTKPSGTSWLRTIWLTFNCICNIPFYAMIFSTILYGVCFYYSNLVLKTILALYWIGCFVDPDPTSGGWDLDTGHPMWGLQLLLPSKYKFHYKYRSACRSNWSFRAVAEYFDMKLVKTMDLNPNQNYMFCYHPHGVISMGANCGLTTNCCDFEKVFPGIHRSGAILDKLFYCPFYRDWLLMNGLVPAHRSTLLQQLTTKEPFCKSIVLIPGGAAEAMHAHAAVMRLHLRKRKGFIKVAIETGCSLVPCIGFGENEMFDTIYGFDDKDNTQPEESSKGLWRAFLKRIKSLIVSGQIATKKLLSYTIPILTNVIPNRHPVVVVVGKPMHFEKTTDFSRQDVDKLHDEYLTQLKELYDQHKGQYGVPGVELEIV